MGRDIHMFIEYKFQHSNEWQADKHHTIKFSEFNWFEQTLMSESQLESRIFIKLV